MTIDIIQLIVWVLLGFIVTWGVFLAWIGFRGVPNYSKRRVAKTLASATFLFGVAWIVIWVSAVVFNFLQIVGVIEWHLM